MSSRQWESYFGRAGWSGPISSTGTAGPFRVGNYTDGYGNDTRAVGVLDQLQYLVEGTLRTDELVTAYVPAAAINRYGVRPQFDSRNLPQCYVYGGAEDGELITLANEVACSVFVEVAFAVSSVLPATDGKASLASFMEYLGWLLVQDQQTMVMTTAGPQGLTTVVRIRPFATNEIEEKQRDGSVALVAYSQTIQVSYTALTDYRTGRFSNLP